MLQQATPDGSTAVVKGDGVYQAENIDHPGIGSESSNAGFTGRGYAGRVERRGHRGDRPVNVAAAGTHTLTLRYAAAAGTATRTVSVGGGAPVTVTFPATSSWSTWATVTVSVPLGTGSNAVTIRNASSSGNT